jgi:large subunit ribosomal protein L11
MEFCKAFNAETQKMEQGEPLPVVITVYQDKTFSFVYKKPPASYLIMKAINIKKASQTPGRDEPIAKITKKQLEEIAETKMSDLNAHTIDDACKILAGTARSMGVEVME